MDTATLSVLGGIIVAAIAAGPAYIKARAERKELANKLDTNTELTTTAKNAAETARSAAVDNSREVLRGIVGIRDRLATMERHSNSRFDGINRRLSDLEAQSHDARVFMARWKETHEPESGTES